MKFKCYTEYIAALSGIVEGRDITAEAQQRHSDAFNRMQLAGSHGVVAALFAFHDELNFQNHHRTKERHDELLTALINALPGGINPGARRKTAIEGCWLLSVPPRARCQT